MKKEMYGYLIGFLISVVIAAIAAYLVFVSFIGMSFGRPNGIVPIILPFLAIGIYLLAAYILAVFTRQVFNSNQGLAFALNLSSIVVVISVVFLWIKIIDFAKAQELRSNARMAIDEAPSIHLEAPFVKKVQNPTGGVILFVHVPFTVSKPVHARSLMLLAPLRISENKIKYSANPDCNSGYDDPAYGFHLVDREYIEPPLPSHVSGTKIVSEQLTPGKRYYLLHERHFGHSNCQISDYDNFDERQINIKLDTARARELL